MKVSTARRRVVDPTIYPVEEKVGEDIIQRLIMEILRPLLQSWLTNRGIKALVGADQFMYYRQHDSTARIAPDVYVILGVDPATRVSSWKVWERGKVPDFAFEVVSQDRDKDYFEAPSRYDVLGVPEVIVFDPHADDRRDGVRWQVFRRVGKRGLVCVEVSQGDRVRSKQLKCWFRSVGEGNETRVRIAVGASGDEIVPTEAEAERAAKESERAAKEAERAAKEAERAAKEVEKAAKEAALAANELAVAATEAALAVAEKAVARVEELEAKLAKRRRSR